MRSRLFAATLACGPDTVVSHRSAANLLGLLDRPPAAIDVIAPGESGRLIDGIRSHRVPQPQREELGHCDAIPCTSPARTIVDLAGTLEERSLRRLVERAAVLGMLNVPMIELVLARSRRRGASTLRTVLNEWRMPDSSGDEDRMTTRRLRSELEARLLALINANGLPTPLCNRAVNADGRHIEVDFIWPDCMLVVEADGRRFHQSPVAFERDRARDRALLLSGYRVIRFTHAQVDSEPDSVVATIRRLLTDRFG